MITSAGTSERFDRGELLLGGMDIMILSQRMGWRPTFDEALRSAIAWKRSGMTWAEIGHRLPYDKDRIREAAKARGCADGWGDSPILWDDWPDGRPAGGLMAAGSSQRDH